MKIGIISHSIKLKEDSMMGYGYIVETLLKIFAGCEIVIPKECLSRNDAIKFNMKNCYVYPLRAIGGCDIIFIINNPHFYQIIDKNDLFNALKNHKRIIHISNDHNVRFYSDLKYIETNDECKFQKEKKEKYVNWNITAYNPERRHIFSDNISNKEYGILYFGAYRWNRLDYLKKYFNGLTKDFYISTSKKDKFEELLENKSIGYFSEKDICKLINKFYITLYLTDKYNVKNLLPPTNRFYEAITAKTILLFGEETQDIFEKYNIDISKFVFRKPEDILNKLEFYKNNPDEYHSDLFTQFSWVKEVDPVSYIRKSIVDILNIDIPQPKVVRKKWW